MNADTPESPDLSASVSPRRERAADRRTRPSFHEIAVAAAEKVGVCVRPLVMGTVNLNTGATDYVAVPCKSTVESQCPTCAKKNRLLRMAQCREGWHLDHVSRVKELAGFFWFQRLGFAGRPVSGAPPWAG